MKKSKHLPRDPIWVCTVQTHSAWSCPLSYVFHALLLFITIFRNDCMIISIENVCITFSWHTKTWCVILFFKIFIFPSPLLTFIEEKMLSALLQKPVFWRQLNSPHCASQWYLPFSFPKLDKQNIVWYRDPSLQTHVLPLPALTQEETMKNTGVSFSIVQNARYEIFHNAWCSSKMPASLWNFLACSSLSLEQPQNYLGVSNT